MRIPASRPAAIGAVVALAALGASCGWHAGLGAPAGSRSVGVEAARRAGTVLERGLEPELTAALSEALLDWVDLPLVAPDEADLVLRGELLEFRRRGGVRNRENQLLETAVFVRARAGLYDRQGNAVVAPISAQEWSAFALGDPASEEAARQRALRHVAVSLVLDLFEPGERVRAPKEEPPPGPEDAQGSSATSREPVLLASEGPRNRSVVAERTLRWTLPGPAGGVPRRR